MSDLDAILAALMGRKVLNRTTGLFQVFGDDGEPITDGGVLLKGAHGALLEWGARKLQATIESRLGRGGGVGGFEVDEYLQAAMGRREQEGVIAALLVAICTSGVLDGDVDMTIRFN